MIETFEIRFLPAGRVARVPGGTTLFVAAHWVGVRIDSTCGGRGICGKCRIQNRDASLGISALDRRHLSATELEDGWRLACTSLVDKNTVCVAPEVLEIPKTALSGDGQPVVLEPGVQRVVLELDPPSDSDSRSDVERLRHGLESVGLPCVVDPDLLSELPSVLRRSNFKVSATVSDQDLICLEPGDGSFELLGVAFDLGTTTIVGSLLDLRTGDTVDVRSALNGQAVFGGDVISRIAYTMPGAGRRDEMQRAVIETMNSILETLCADSGVDPLRIYEAVVVGNSTMLHLLLGVEARSLSVAPFVPTFRESLRLPAGRIGLRIHPNGRLTTLAAVGAYVGADTVAGLHATGLDRQENLWLFIDVGTNSEIALGSSKGIVATAAPAGPAFEGSCIRSGMAATTGAIERVVLGDDVGLEVVGGGPARGICGSGLIDTVAQLVRVGLLDESGRLSARSEAVDHPLASRLVSQSGEKGFELTQDVRLMQRDIRELQSAKSSVATGVQVLLEHLGVAVEDVGEVLLAGSFGSSIDPENARQIGLVPDLPLARIRFVGNVAAEGARMALLSFRERQMIDDLAVRTEYVELSNRPDFNDLFVEGLSFPGRIESDC